MANQMSWSPSSACSPGSPTCSSSASPLDVATGVRMAVTAAQPDHEDAVRAPPCRTHGQGDGAEGGEGEQDDDGVHDQRVDGEAVDEVEHGPDARAANLHVT